MTRGERRSWIIPVCRTCERLAVWPFCEHRPDYYVPPETPLWYEDVPVYTYAKRKPLPQPPKETP